MCVLVIPSVFTSFIVREKKRKQRVIDCCNRLFFLSLFSPLGIVFFAHSLVRSMYSRADGAYTIIIICIWVQDKNDESLFYDWRQQCMNSQWAQWIATMCETQNIREKSTSHTKKTHIKSANRQHVTICEYVCLAARNIIEFFFLCKWIYFNKYNVQMHSSIRSM